MRSPLDTHAIVIARADTDTGLTVPTHSSALNNLFIASRIHPYEYRHRNERSTVNIPVLGVRILKHTWISNLPDVTQLMSGRTRIGAGPSGSLY